MDFDLKECCEALRVSRSGYYRWGRAEPSRREKENAQLVEQIREVFEANKSRYGSPRVTRELRQRGLKCGQNRIARLMRENELAARAKKAFRPRTTLPGGGAAPNLIKGLEPTGVNQVWVSDITYIATLRVGFIWRSFWTCSAAKWWAGNWEKPWPRSWSLPHWKTH